MSPSVNTSVPCPYSGEVSAKASLAPDFPRHLAALRKDRSLTQLALAERVGVHVVQLRRYEAGTSQPTLDVIRRLAIALGGHLKPAIGGHLKSGQRNS